MKNIATVSEIGAAIKDESHYQWGLVKKKFNVSRKGKPYPMARGDRVGIRLSSDKKSYRFINEKLPASLVFTLPMMPKTRLFLSSRVEWSSFEKIDRKEDPEALLNQQRKQIVPCDINFQGVVSFMASVVALALKEVISEDKKGKEGIEDLLSRLNEDHALSYTRVVARDLIVPIRNWYSGAQSPAERKAFIDLCKACFKFTPGKYTLFRGTRLREKLELGYAFKLQTTRKQTLQSWSESPEVARDFTKSGAVILKSSIPARFMLVSHHHWATLHVTRKQLSVAIAKVVLKKMPAFNKPEVARYLAICIVDIFREMARDGGAHDEDEIVVDFTEVAFKPLSQVIYKG